MNTLSLFVLAGAFGMPAALTTTATPPAIAFTQDDVQETASGSIKSVNKEAKSFVVAGEGEGAKDITVTVNDTTVYMKDGKISTMDEVLKTGNNVTVTHKKGVASKVETFTKE